MPQTPSRPIVLIEPQCRGREHVPFNLALLRTAQLAAPDRRLLFAAESSHLAEVQQAWQQQGFPQAALQWVPIEVPPRHVYSWSRMLPEWQALRQWLPQIKVVHPAAIVFTSITPNLLLLLKTLYRGGLAGAASVLAIPHQNLSGLAWPRRWLRPWSWPLHMRTALSTANPHWLQIVILGESLLACCREAIGNEATSRWAVLDHPYLFPPAIGQNSAQPAAGKPVFGYFGSNIDGLTRFAGLARQLQSSGTPVRFLLAGFAHPSIENPGCVEGWSNEPISAAEYAARARQFDFTVWTASAHLYNFTASAAFLDALGYGKPLLYLANRFIDSYVQHSGPIGFRAEQMEDMPGLITGLVSSPVETGDFARNMAVLRERFSPEHLARRLSTLWRFPDA